MEGSMVRGGVVGAYLCSSLLALAWHTPHAFANDAATKAAFIAKKYESETVVSPDGTSVLTVHDEIEATNDSAARELAQLSLSFVLMTRDMSGACSRRPVRFFNRSKTGGENEADRVAARTATDEVRDGSGPLAARGAEPGGSGGDSGRDGTDVSALVSALRGGWPRRAVGPAVGQAVSQAGAGGVDGSARAALSRALRRLQREALLGASGEGSSLSVQLQLGQELPAPAPAGAAHDAEGDPSQEAAAASHGRHDAASGRLAPPLGSRA